MGLLSEGRPLSWEETKKCAPMVQKLAALQFLRIYHREKDRNGDKFKWGDEIEFTLVTFSSDKQKAQLNLLAPLMLPILQQPEVTNPTGHLTKWMPEFARYMVEGTPGAEPYGDNLSNVQLVEENIKLRRQQICELLKDISPGTFPVTLSVFPRLGCPGFTTPEYEPRPKTSVMKSHTFPDEVAIQIEEQPRFMTLVKNLYERRKGKIYSKVPVFRDAATPSPFRTGRAANREGIENGGCRGLTENGDHMQNGGSIENGSSVENDDADDFIFLDCLAYGTGCCSLQVTLQAGSLSEACYMYDQLAVLCPIMHALSAASPIFHGYLADVDCRWNILCDISDDRTLGEMGKEPLEDGEVFMPRSRWDSIEGYLATTEYNDKEEPYNREVFEQLRKEGVDEGLALHVAYMLLRDPLLLLDEPLHNPSDTSTYLYDNLLLTNWQSVRLKHPLPNGKAAWRVEFRTIELQLTDYENSAFAVFMMLLVRTILSLRPNLYIPISKLDENMATALVRDAAQSGKFYFCKDILPNSMSANHCSDVAPDGMPNGGGMCSKKDSYAEECKFPLMDIDTIVNGKGDFIGLIPLIKQYLRTVDITERAQLAILQILTFISRKASGETKTTATWIREFVTSHPKYKRDSHVPDEIVCDLMSRVKEISEGLVPCEELTGRPNKQPS